MNWAWAASLDHLWRSPSFPMWITLAAALFFAIVLLTTLARAEKSVANGALTVITLLAIGIAVAATIRGFGGGDKIAHTTTGSQSVASLPALSCLEGLAGENVEAACEKALFASADATAAAVSYTSRQLLRLSALGADPVKLAAMPELTAMRRVLERDRYGLVAQVLTTRDRCEPSACEAFRSLTDHKQVAANMTDKTYDNFVGRHSLAWGVSLPATAGVSAPALAATTAFPAPTVPTGKPTSADFPTSASIPPVNIMGTEPAAPASRAAAPSQVTPVAPPRSPSATANAASGTSPTQAATSAPAKRPPPAKQQRTTAPVQLAPPAAGDDN